MGSFNDNLISVGSSSSEALYSSKKLHPLVMISNGISPVLLRLVKWVEQGLLEMAELHPNFLDSVQLKFGDQPSGSTKRLPEIVDIVDWIQCFGIYIAIISRSKPQRIYSRLDKILEHHSWGFTAGPRRSLDSLRSPLLPQSIGLSHKTMVHN